MNDRYWLWSPDGGFRVHATAAERDADFQRELDMYCRDGFWAEDITYICGGEIQLVATQVNRKDRPPPEELDADGYDADGLCWDSGMAFHCDYALRPLARVAPNIPGGPA